MVLNVCVGFDIPKQKEVYKKYNFQNKNIKAFLDEYLRAVGYEKAVATAERLSKMPKTKKAKKKMVTHVLGYRL